MPVDFADTTAEVVASYSWHHDIQEDQAKIIFFEKFDGYLGIGHDEGI